MPAPLFSVIIACRNPGAPLLAAVASVRGQQGGNCELVIVDGASTDGTVDRLATLQAEGVVVVSESDTGVYAAMNKGARLARGRWLLFLGADDRLAAPDVLACAQAAIGATDAGLCCGEACYTDGRVWRAPRAPCVGYRNFLHHQAAFYHRTLFERFHYDAALRIQADYDLNLQLWQAGVKPRPLATQVAVCGVGGLSDAGRWLNYREEIAVRHRYFPAWQCWGWDAASLARYWRKKFLRFFRSG